MLLSPAPKGKGSEHAVGARTSTAHSRCCRGEHGSHYDDHPHPALPERNQSAIPFLIGWVVGMAVVVVIAAVGANALPVRPVSRAAEGDRYRSDPRRDCSTRRCGDDLATGGPSPSGQRERVARSRRPDGTCGCPRVGPGSEPSTEGFAAWRRCRPVGCRFLAQDDGRGHRSWPSTLVSRPPRSSFRSLRRSSRRLGCSLVSFWPATGSATTAPTSLLWCWSWLAS